MDIFQILTIRFVDSHTKCYLVMHMQGIKRNTQNNLFENTGYSCTCTYRAYNDLQFVIAPSVSSNIHEMGQNVSACSI